MSTRLIRRASGLRLSILLALSVHSHTGSAQGLAQELGAQPLALALETFAEQADLQFVYRAGLTTDIPSAGAPAGLSVAETLRALLLNTGLTFEFLDERTVVIRPADEKSKINRSTLQAGPVVALAAASGEVVRQRSSAGLIPDEASSSRLEVAEVVTVTGSRLQTDSFSSLAPIQVITGEAARAVGVADAASMVQQSSIATGFQFDNSITSDSDVRATGGSAGAATVSLRGLSPDRTLVLVNSRRLAPSGVEGAPTQPDLNLIPSALIERIEVLTDGASSVYGSDAVAGVVNIILKDRFEGLEVTGFTSQPQEAGAEVQNFSLIAGLAGDAGHITFGAEFYERRSLRRSQRDYARCRQALEQDIATGRVSQYCVDFGGTGGGALNLFFDQSEIPDAANPRELIFDYDTGQGFARRAMGLDLCDATDSILGLGTNTTGVPCVFTLGDGQPDLLAPFGFDSRYNTNGYTGRQDLISPLTRYVTYITGEQELEFLNDSALFFEASYANRQVDMSRGPIPIGGGVNTPCSNPFIQANSVLSTSVTCGAAAGDPPTSSSGLLSPPGPSLNWNPGFDVLGSKRTEVEQVRGVLGLRGSLGDAIDSRSATPSGFAVAFGNWEYEIFGSYTRSNGASRAKMIDRDRLALSLNTARLDVDDANSDGRTDDIICGATVLGSLSTRCVALDPTDPIIYLQNELPAQAADYLLGDATNRTTMTQTIFSGHVTGEILSVPAGVVPLVLGVEHRKDEIESRNSYLITSGAGIGGLSQPELDTVGSRYLTEFFIETELPLLRERRFANLLALNASGRWTDESNFGSLWTYRLQAAYSPTPSLTFKSTYGTTYRAPNLREQFLADQFSSLLPSNDPCLRLTGGPPITDPVLVANCRAQGADPDLLGLGASSLSQINVRRGGADDLEAETSRSITYGAVFDQPWWDAFGLKLSATYFDIEVKKSVAEPGAGDILMECLLNTPDLASPFCSRITRSTPGTPQTNFIDVIDASFFNIGVLNVRGVDFNLRFDKRVELMKESFGLHFDLAATRQLEASEDLLGRTDENLGEVEYPKLQGAITTGLTWRDLTVLWRARYSDGGIPDAFGTPEYPTSSTGSAILNGFSDPTTIQQTGMIDPDGDGAPGTLAFQRPNHFPVGRVDSYWYHDLSGSLRFDTWSATVGVSNLFNETPAAVNRRGLTAGQFGIVAGAGQDLIGRAFFMNFSKTFR